MVDELESVPEDQEISTGQRQAGRAGAEHAFDAVFRANYLDVLRYASRRSPTRAAAEDIAAETFAIAWRRFDAMPADALPWLLGVARHVILNQQRSDRRRDRLVARLSADRSDPSETSSEQSLRDVLDAFGRLSERDQEVLRLTAWEGLAASRGAVVLGCSRGAFAVRLHRARRRLAAELRGGPPPSPPTSQPRVARGESRQSKERLS